MKVFVISLPKAKERQKQISKKLSEAGIDFEFFMGVDGREAPDSLFELYNESRRLKIKGEPMLSGQLGCFASHYKLWLRCLKANESFIVLEDDAHVQAELFLEFVSLAKGLDEQYECIRLFRNKSRIRNAVPVQRLGGFEILKYFKGHMSTTGYYITPNGAKKFIEGASEWVLPVDIYMDQFWGNKVECYGVEPPCLTNDETLDSLIDYIPKKDKKRKNIIVKANREVYSLRNNVRRFLWNLRFLVQARKLFERTRF